MELTHLDLHEPRATTKTDSMNIYRVSFKDSCDEHKGYNYFATLKDAEKVASAYKHGTAEIETHAYRATNKGMIEALNDLANHPDNG